MARRIFITVAEVSGDLHAAQLIRALRQLDPEIQIEGHGGEAMRSAGAVIHHETVGGAAMGLGALGRITELRRVVKWTGKYFRDHPPDLQICIDSPALNFHFAKAASGAGIPVLYYIAPQLWAWREGRMKKLRRWVDRVACILPFEEEYFRRHNVDATFVGHPLFDELPADRSRPPGPHFPDAPPIIGILAGSRKGEAHGNLPPMLDAADIIRKEFPGVRFLLPTTAATHPIAEALIAARSSPADFTLGLDQFDDMVRRCDLCITVSGTATLHVAGFAVPMIVVYRGNRVLWHLIGRWLIKTRTYSLVNLLSDSHDHVVPEFIPWFGDPAPVATRALQYLTNPAQLSEQSAKLRQLVRALDKPGASINTAKIAMDMLEKSNPEPATNVTN